MNKHTDYEFLRALADERERFVLPDAFTCAQVKQLRAIADQIEQLSKQDATITAIVVMMSCDHRVQFVRQPHIAEGHVLPCPKCGGQDRCVTSVLCVTIDPLVT